MLLCSLCKLYIFTAHGVVDYHFANFGECLIWKSSGKLGDQWVKIVARRKRDREPSRVLVSLNWI